MTVADFIARWSASGASERANKDLFFAELCDVLEVPRPEPATGKERAIHEPGLVSVLRQIHDDLEAAVFDADGWPHDLTDEQILERLVALNRERADEEQRGLVRWLRPDFPSKGKAPEPSQAEMLALPAPRPTAGEPLPWPKSLPERSAAGQPRPGPPHHRRHLQARPPQGHRPRPGLPRRPRPRRRLRHPRRPPVAPDGKACGVRHVDRCSQASEPDPTM